MAIISRCEVSGPHRDHVIAFARRRGRDAAIVAVAKSFAPFIARRPGLAAAEAFDGALDVTGYAVEGVDGTSCALAAVPHLPVAVLKSSGGVLKPVAQNGSRASSRAETRRPPGIDGRTAWRMSCRLARSVPFLRTASIVRQIVTSQACTRICRTAMRCVAASSAFGQQQIAPIPDRGLRYFGESLQQPGQRHFHPDMIVRDIEMTRRRLPQRADAKDHAIAVPALFVDFQHRNAGRGARQSVLQAARRLLAAEADAESKRPAVRTSLNLLCDPTSM